MEIRILSGWSVLVIRQILGWAVRILLPCALLFGLIAGINWLAQQPWGSGSVSFSCPNGEAVVYQDTDHGQKTLLWCP